MTGDEGAEGETLPGYGVAMTISIPVAAADPDSRVLLMILLLSVIVAARNDAWDAAYSAERWVNINKSERSRDTGLIVIK